MWLIKASKSLRRCCGHWSVSATDLRRCRLWLPIRQRFIYELSVLTYRALHTGQPYYLADLIDFYEPSRCLRSTNCHLLAVPSCVKSSFAVRAFCVYLRLLIGILSLCTSAHLTVLSLSNPSLNLTFSLLPITSSHPHASASDSTLDFLRYINVWLTFTLTRRKFFLWQNLSADFRAEVRGVCVSCNSKFDSMSLKLDLILVAIIVT